MATVVEAVGTRSKGSDRGPRQVRSKSVCFNFRDTGDCKRGDKCPFEHASGGSQPDRKAARGGFTCLAHGSGGHSTEGCNLLLKNPALKAALLQNPALGFQSNYKNGNSNSGDKSQASLAPVRVGLHSTRMSMIVSSAT